MACSSFLAVAFIGIASLQQVIALKCWRCDSVQDDYCGEPFTGNSLTRASTYIECPPKQTGSVNVCVKAKVKQTGVIIRQCASSAEDAELVCNFGLNSADYCETCNRDGCNIGAQFRPIAKIVAVPMLIATLALLF